MDIHNRKARYDYEILDTYVAGMSLLGSEVKSLCANNANINNAWCQFDNDELFLTNAFISKYKGTFTDHEETRNRKLLLNKSELRKLEKEVKTPGYSIIPLHIFKKNNYIKIEIALCRGKKDYDKRETIKQRDIERETYYRIK